ncbi:MAG: phosphoglucosamine mutase [Candidatus Aminicenantes bacterium]|nr:phosphoglucosamine mutase [Candidatus Aminicenantes bacterium]
MSANLFGTDGIRSSAGRYPLDGPTLLRLGSVLGSLFSSPRVLIGHDTRESGPDIQAQLARGLGRGARVFTAGVIPTPGLSFLTRSGGYDLGIMISASHNPFNDNGIKLFDHRGEKISTRLERSISTKLAGEPRTRRGPARPLPEADAGAYVDFMLREGRDLDGGAPEGLRRLAVDCANGAASLFAPSLFARLGTEAIIAHASPDGRNINAGCGSTHPRVLQELVRHHRASLGLALDGDADRVIFSDAQGRILTGDHALFLIARYLRESEPRFQGKVVGTVMANLGLEQALRRLNIEFLRADVGDRQVHRLMKRSGSILGGEPSGHIILRHRQTSGDGLLTALFFMKALRHFSCDAAAVFESLPLFPQETLNLRIRRRRDLKSWTAFQREASRFAVAHGKRARLLVRYSGTEPKIRIMIEARDRETIESTMPIFQSLVENDIGE